MDLTIFHVFSDAHSTIEPVHSRTLAYFLIHDPIFRRGFMERFLPESYRDRNGLGGGVEPTVTVTPEDRLLRHDRIDITLKFQKALVGIEVKTRDASTTLEQLHRYWLQLEEEHQALDLFMIFITPFSPSNLPAPEARDRVQAIGEFASFELEHPGRGVHANWMEVSALYPAEGDRFLGGIYDHHKRYIKDVLCDMEVMTCRVNTRDLETFLGGAVVESLFSHLRSEGVVLGESQGEYLIALDDQPRIGGIILDALRILLEADTLNPKARKSDTKNTAAIKLRFLQGPFRNFYQELFAFAAQCPFAWLKAGTTNIGFRAAHPKYPGGVSLVTLYPDHIGIRKTR